MLQVDVEKKRYCWNCGGDHHIVQCTETILKLKEKKGPHAQFDDESAFLSLHPDCTVSTFIPDPDEIYFQNDNLASNLIDHHVAFPSSVVNDFPGIKVSKDYSFLRLYDCADADTIDDDTESLYETITDFVTSSHDDASSSMSVLEPTCLVAQVAYDDGNDTTSWILDSGSTHHMNGFADEFLNLESDGYVDGVMVKGLTTGTKAYGIGTCVIVCKGEDGLFQQFSLQDVLYVPNLMHHHSRIFSVISACSQDGFKCNFQANSYVLSMQTVQIQLQLSKGLLWIPTVTSPTVPQFVMVVLRLRDARSETMFLTHRGSDNTITVPGGYMRQLENPYSCGLRIVLSQLGIRLERHNQLHRRFSSIVLLDSANPIHLHICTSDFWLEELATKGMCPDVLREAHLCKQFVPANGLTYKLTDYKTTLPNTDDYGVLVSSNVVKVAAHAKITLHGFDTSMVSSLIDLWSICAELSHTGIEDSDTKYMSVAPLEYRIP